MPIFSIRSEDGLQRRSRIQVNKGTKKLNAPTLILPINNHLLKIPSYTKILKKFPNIVVKIYDPNQQIPEFLKSTPIICNNTYNYYDTSGRPHSFFQKNRKQQLNPNYLYIAKKNCPSGFFNLEFHDQIYNGFKKELLEELKYIYEKEGHIDTGDLKYGIFYEYYQYKIKDQTKQLIEILNTELIKNSIKILELSGLFDNLMFFKDIIDSILELKSKLAPDIIISVSGKIPIYLFPFLAYIGIDLIDCSHQIYMGFKEKYITDDDIHSLEEIKLLENINCSCTACLEILDLINETKNQEPNLPIQNILGQIKNVNILFAVHNVFLSINKMKHVRAHMKKETLRFLVEKTAMNSTFIISSLRYLDTMNPNPIVTMQKLYKKSQLLCSTNLSYNNPEVLKFQERVKNRCYPQSDVLMAILLPCSMGKPYSKSRSHRKFLKIIRKTSGDLYQRISQAIVTSPLGLVPRYIEDIYPAAHYDISVTGKWDYEEIRVTGLCIRDWLEKFDKDIPIIAYLYGGYRDSLESVENEFSNRIIITEDLEEFETILRKEMGNIRSRLADKKDEYNKEKISNTLSLEEREIITKMDFQFGQDSGRKIIGNAARLLQMRNPHLKEIYGYESYGKTYLGRLDNRSGQIKLSFEGGKRIFKANNHYIKLNTNDIMGSTLFQPALEYANEELCSGDEVLIIGAEDNYIGIGKMVVNGITANKLRSGAILKIRKKII
ncbi:MAG: hypothetical protein GF364_06080 [Candidatus Lokiarchaeota archaeon]|nr:hypothetical protein [Candidatus Lokiarchaeota archaeon]